MPTRIMLLASAVIMTILGGVLIGSGLNTTPIGTIVGSNAIVLFLVGASIGIAAWAFISVVTLSLCSELLFVTMQGEHVDSLGYLLSALLIGNAGALKIVEKGEVKTFMEGGPFASFSTPGYVVIYHGNAVVFEQYGKPSRVGLKGLVKTKSLETIRTVLDLSLQQRKKQVTLFTKDGIPLQTEIHIFFQIHPGGHKPTVGDMYPVLEQAVLNATYTVADWREYTVERAVAAFRSMITERYLQEIYDPMKQLTPENDRPKTGLRMLRNDLQACLDQETFTWGVKIQNLIIDVKPPREIEDQALAYEKTRMEQQIAIENARTENMRIKEFMDQTGGSVTDYALIHFCENVGEGASVPFSVDQMLSDAFQRATLRTSRRQERETNKTAQHDTKDE